MLCFHLQQKTMLYLKIAIRNQTGSINGGLWIARHAKHCQLHLQYSAVGAALLLISGIKTLPFKAFSLC
jgi:hypothetical protein